MALQATPMPHIEWSRAFFSVLVAILGTTISPYLCLIEQRRAPVGQ
jgi:Mn2+/Fe2+ NRAMP family transporter